MTSNRMLVFSSALFMIAVFCIHFINKVYVNNEHQERTIETVQFTLPDSRLPYNADILGGLLARWAALTEAEKQPENTDASLEGYDHSQLGDLRITLLAIYQSKKPKAVLAVQEPDKPIQFLRLREGELIGDIVLSRVKQRDIILSKGTQQVQLRLFNPGQVSTDQ